MLNELNCKICGYEASTKQGFNSHISHKHHIKSKDYYDTYLKKDGEGICFCGNPTKFRDMWYGYNKHCCTRCIPLDPKIQDKMKATCMEHYGVDNIWKDRDSRMRAKKKAQQSMHKNGNRSSLEDLLEQYFIENHIKYESEYNKDTRYPYFCDFYLPESDTFIEINGFWTHGGHWFDENNLEDINKLNELIEKSKVHSMYKTCIRVWTQSDVEKRNCAKNNKLNYVVLWSKQDIIDWIDSGLEIRHDY